MGFYIDVTLKIENADHEEILKRVVENNKYEFIRQTFEHDFESGGSVFNRAFDEFVEQLALLSIEFKDILFELFTTGESHKDLSVIFFKNGRYYEEEGEIVFPSFDETKLNLT